MFALLISIPRFKSNIFHQNSPKIKLFLQKNAKFSSVGISAPSPPASGGWGLSSWTFDGFRRLRSQTPKTAYPIENFWLQTFKRGLNLISKLRGLKGLSILRISSRFLISACLFYPMALKTLEM